MCDEFSVKRFQYTEDMEGMPRKPVVVFLIDSAAYDWVADYQKLPVCLTHNEATAALADNKSLRYNRFTWTTDLTVADYSLLDNFIVAVCHEKWKGSLEWVYMWKEDSTYFRTSEVKENESESLLTSILNDDIWRQGEY